MESNQTVQVKKLYNKPVLTPHGAVEEVTLASSGAAPNGGVRDMV